MKGIWFLLLALSTSGCYYPALKMNVIASSQLNKDAAGRSLPVRVRIYQLRDKARFENASFHALWQQDKKTLRESFIDRLEYSVQPGQHLALRLSPSQDAKYVGVVAIFRNPEGRWRSVQEVPLLRRMELRLYRNRVELQ